jgi:hypothetical protein
MVVIAPLLPPRPRDGWTSCGRPSAGSVPIRSPRADRRRLWRGQPSLCSRRGGGTGRVERWQRPRASPRGRGRRARNADIEAPWRANSGHGDSIKRLRTSMRRRWRRSRRASQTDGNHLSRVVEQHEWWGITRTCGPCRGLGSVCILFDHLQVNSWLCTFDSKVKCITLHASVVIGGTVATCGLITCCTPVLLLLAISLAEPSRYGEKIWLHASWKAK